MLKLTAHFATINNTDTLGEGGPSLALHRHPQRSDPIPYRRDFVASHGYMELPC